MPYLTQKYEVVFGNIYCVVCASFNSEAQSFSYDRLGAIPSYQATSELYTRQIGTYGAAHCGGQEERLNRLRGRVVCGGGGSRQLGGGGF
jgi:hypothetical protein